MGIIPKSRYDSFHHFPPAQPKKKLWDPFTTLGFNPDGGSFTCVGIAKSTKERCCNPINKANRASSFQLLEDLSYIDVSTTDINAELHKLARLSLCLRNHQSQQNDMVKNWSKAIKKTQSASRNNIKIKIDPDEFEELLKYKEALIAHLRNRNDGAKEFMFSSPTSQRYPKQNDGQSAQEERTRKQREEETRKSRERERERERQQQEREKEAREEKEKMKRNEEKAQQKRAEEKAKQKREEEKRCREEQEAREREAREREERNERVRQRADQARKERERKAKEQAAKARDEWDESWLKYVLQWDKLKKQDTKATSEKLQDIIPWPVKSGDLKDLSTSAIEEFFRNAPPPTGGVEKMFLILKMECLKWHTDRIPKMFGAIEDKTLAGHFNTVVQVVIKIRAEIGRKRER